MRHTATTGFWGWLDAFFQTFAGKLVEAAIIVIVAILIAWVLRTIIRSTVHRIVTRVKQRHGVDDTQSLVATPVATARIVQRSRTLGSVLTNIANVAITIITGVLVVNVLVPEVIGSLALITAAVGAGLGFGAQNIVKDVLNGIFIVIEDQFGIGDEVDTGFATGVVESVGIRITTVRDTDGTLWYVRNGEILRVGNMSQSPRPKRRTPPRKPKPAAGNDGSSEAGS